MTDPPSSSSAVLDDLLSTLPQETVGAAELLSVPHWVDDSTAIDLISRFSAANGTTVAALADVKRLPFVSPLGADQWKVASPAREILAGRIEENRELSRRVDGYLADRFAAHAEPLPNDARAARELRWVSIYHRMPVAPQSAFAELDAFVDRAASVGQLSDMRAAVELTERRSRWLVNYQVEVAFVVGRTAYEFGDWGTAEDRFLRVWESDTDSHRRIVSGHLLGVIWSKRNREPWWSKAEQVLSDAAALAHAHGERYGEAMILTTLGTLRLRLGGERRLEQAESVLRRSLELGAHRGGMMEGLALSSLGAVLVRRGSPAQLLEAEVILRRSLAVLPADAQGAVEDRLANVLGRLGGQPRLREAEQLLNRRLEQEMSAEETAVTLNMLATTLMRRGDVTLLPSAEDAAQRSIGLGKELGNQRHTAMALLTGSFIAEKSGDLTLSIARMEELIEINER
ncbi:MAG: hypothetical protein ACLPVY_05235, partial [Acidimicrobiia bacterium]